MWPFTTGPTIADWNTAYMQYACRFTKSTQQAKAFAFRCLIDSFGPDKRVSRISKADILGFLTTIAHDRSPGSANEIAKKLKAAWNWGITYHNMPKDNPFILPKFPQDENSRYVPPIQDFWQVYALTAGKDALLLLTALHTAARRGELFRLTWEDVSLEGRTIRLGTRKRQGGGMEYDWIPMTEELGDSFEPIKGDEKEYVFGRPDGQPYKARATMLRRLCAKAGVHRFGFHGIRHLSASLMAQGHMPISEIQTVLRHKNPMTTCVYIHNLGVVKTNMDRIFSRRLA